MYFYNLGQFFNDIVEKFGDNISIRYKDKNYTYNVLNQKAQEYACFLLNNNLQQGDVVAIVNTKEFEAYAMMIACLKIGITYVNLDIDNPEERTEKILDNCKPVLVFSDQEENTYIQDQKIKTICKRKNILYFNIDTAISKSDNVDKYLINKVDSSTIAYIMFTSGSTGTPKGAAITHQNLLHFTEWTTNRYNIKYGDNFANLSPMYFDNSVFDFYTALFNGASLTPVKKDLLTNPFELIKYIDEMQCTIWFSVPSLLIYLINMKVITHNTLNNIRIFTFGGEGFPKTELKKLFELKKQAKFINVYGPTECTCICSSYDISESDFDDLNNLPSLGIMNQNFSYMIINIDGKEDKEGELCLIGPNVGSGYYNDEERTYKAFYTCLDKKNYLKKMYRTGDLVTEKNGLLYFKGRKDNQIKHMGYRIELEEIEFAINSIPEIEQSAVIYKRIKDAYGKIIAYIASKDKNVEVSKIKEKLSQILPSYMIPNTFIILENLPKNQNGKIDKKQLSMECVQI